MKRRSIVAGLIAIVLAACGGQGSEGTTGTTGSSGTTGTTGAGGGGGSVGRGPRPIPAPTFLSEMPARLVAVGDLHGDLQATLAALTAGGLIDEKGHWTGGETVVVQTGDQIDRGDDDRAILDYLEVLADEAWEAGGALYVLNGNHETMNVDIDFRYVTDDSFTSFAEFDTGASDPLLDALEVYERGRAVAFRPGGQYAMMLSGHNTMMQIGDSVFVHGGLLPTHVNTGLLTMNDTIRAWMRGDITKGHEDYIGSDGPVWIRHYSDEPDEADCALLGDALALLGAKRMVVGHTVQKHINAECDGRVWRIDVGMSAYYEGVAAVLEIVDGTTKVLK